MHSRIPVYVCCLGLVLAGCRNIGQNKVATSKNVKPASTTAPLSIALTTAGSSLTIDTSGQGMSWSGLDAFSTSSKQRYRSFKLSPTQMKQLRRVVEQQKFFDLRDEYGDHVFDYEASWIRVTLGRKSKLVTLLYLGNWRQNGHKQLREVERALKVWDCASQLVK